MLKGLSALVVCSLVLFFSLASIESTDAAEMKVGVMNVQQVLVNSVSGKAAKDKFDQKMQDLQSKFKAEEQELVDMQGEIEKKSSAWSEETKQLKVREFQDKELAPILKALEGVVDTYGKNNSFTLILDSKAGVIYFSDAVDITDELVKELDSAMAAN